MATKAEQRWMSDIVALGCIACYVQGFLGTPAEVHHLLRGGRRIGHLHSIPLCSPGHHRNGDGVRKISRHPFKRRFEKAYGSEAQLLFLTQQLVTAKGKPLTAAQQYRNRERHGHFGAGHS